MSDYQRNFDSGTTTAIGLEPEPEPNERLTIDVEGIVKVNQSRKVTLQIDPLSFEIELEEIYK